MPARKGLGPRKKMPGKGLARRTKLSQVVVEAILESVEAGAFIGPACRAAGIGESTYFNWMRLGERGVVPYKDFYERVRTAEAKAEDRAVKCVANAMTEQWQAAAWFLERKYKYRKTEYAGSWTKDEEQQPQGTMVPLDEVLAALRTGIDSAKANEGANGS